MLEQMLEQIQRKALRFIYLIDVDPSDLPSCSKLKKQPKSPRIRFDLEKLQNVSMAEAFHAKIGGKFAALVTISEDVESMANDLKEFLIQSAEEVIGRSRKKKQEWMNEECLDLCDKTRELKPKRHTCKTAE